MSAYSHSVSALHGLSLLLLLGVALDESLSAAPACGNSLKSNQPPYIFIPPALNSELTAAVPDPNEHRTWMRSQADSANSRYSALSQINRRNVRHLKIAWTYRSRDGGGNVQANPVIVDGTIYAPTAGHNIVALDGKSGTELWRFNPLAGESAQPSDVGYGPAHRGLAYWSGDSAHGPQLFFMGNGYLFALSPKSGQRIEGFGDRGRVPASKGAGASTFLGAVAPAIYQNIIIAPNQNFIDAFDVTTGARLWSFNTLQYPVQDPEADNGGNIWGGIAMDAQRGIVFAAVGDPHPNFVGVGRPGNNPYTNSVIALDARSGRLIWSFQDVPHDLWDVDTAAPPNLVTIEHAGRRVDAVAEVTKSGNTLLLDRLTGKPLFPFRMKRAPVSTLPGEDTAPYQPAVELPEPFTRQAFSLDEVTTLTFAAHARVLEQVRGANFGWFVPFEEGKPTVTFPGTIGGAEWSGAAFDPVSQMLYVTANEIPAIVTVSLTDGSAFSQASNNDVGFELFAQHCAGCHGSQGEGRGMVPPIANVRSHLTIGAVADILKTGRGAMPPIVLPELQRHEILAFLYRGGSSDQHAASLPRSNKRPAYTADGFNRLFDDRGYPGVKPPWGTLNAIDLRTGKIHWKVPLGEYEGLVREGVAKTGTLNFGGATVTAGGLVFCGGTPDLKIRAFDATNGEELWQYKLPYGGYAPPATYEVNGRQYVIIAAAGGGKLGTESGDAYVAFALPPRGQKPTQDLP